MAPKPSCLSARGLLNSVYGETDFGNKGILKAPRVLLVVIFPIISFILYCGLFVVLGWGVRADKSRSNTCSWMRQQWPQCRITHNRLFQHILGHRWNGSPSGHANWLLG